MVWERWKLRIKKDRYQVTGMGGSGGRSGAGQGYCYLYHLQENFQPSLPAVQWHPHPTQQAVCALFLNGACRG
jgi:hypothetical protein